MTFRHYVRPGRKKLIEELQRIQLIASCVRRDIVSLKTGAGVAASIGKIVVAAAIDKHISPFGYRPCFKWQWDPENARGIKEAESLYSKNAQ
mmetsp:Transcript_20490/g.50275  ORF Transcript_20490/g.50275 Transcript_20490/m.50275 type:complete len:92 (-) Transcript_20490:81-356(-)